MHILLLILGVLGGIAGIMWRIHMAREAARTIGDLAGEAANLPRKMRFKSKTGKDGLDLVEDPREAAAVLMVNAARAGEAFDDAEKTAIREELAAMLSASDAQAGDWLARGIWLSEKVVDPVNTVRRMTDFLIARVGEDEIRQLDAALARITRTGRPASHEQKLFLHRFRERAGLSG